MRRPPSFVERRRRNLRDAYLLFRDPGHVPRQPFQRARNPWIAGDLGGRRRGFAGRGWRRALWHRTHSRPAKGFVRQGKPHIRANFAPPGRSSSNYMGINSEASLGTSVLTSLLAAEGQNFFVRHHAARPFGCVQNPVDGIVGGRHSVPLEPKQYV